MNLAAIAARRLILRRGAAFLGAALMTGPKSDNVPDFPSLGSAPPSAPYPSATSTMGYDTATLHNPFDTLERERLQRENERRSNIERKIEIEYDVIRQGRYDSRNAWNDQDDDLLVLASTTRAWRASVMRDRIKERARLRATFNEKIRRIWKEPLDALEKLATEWLGEIL